MVDLKQLHAIPLCQALSPEGLKQIQSASTQERYKKGMVLFRQGERAEAMWLVVDGWVHLVRSPEPVDAERGIVLFTITPDEVLCGVSAIESGRYNLSAVAGTDCLAVKIPGAVFRDTLRREPEFTYHVLRLCARRLQHIAEQYGAMAESVSHRIIRAILRLHHQFGRTLPVTHRELAQMSWTTTESAIRVVRRLKHHGYVTGTRGRLVVKHSNALERALAHPNGHKSL